MLLFCFKIGPNILGKIHADFYLDPPYTQEVLVSSKQYFPQNISAIMSHYLPE